MKILTKSTFFRKYTPQMLLFHIFLYMLDQYWYIFPAKMGFKNFQFFPHYKNHVFPIFKNMAGNVFPFLNSNFCCI